VSRRVGATILAAVLLAAGCSSDGEGTAATAATTSTTSPQSAPVPAALDPAACARLAANAVVPAQSFLDDLADVTADELEAMETPPDFAVVQADIQRRADEAIGLGCDPATFQQTVDAAVATLSGEGEVAEEIAAVLRGEVTPEVPGARDTEPSEVTVTPDDDVAAVLAAIGPGSTITFDAGTYELAETLLVGTDVRLIGAGADQTIIESSAEGVALAFVGPGGIVVEGMAIEHTGDSAATVMLAIEGPVTVRDAELRGAVSGTGEEGGGHGLALAFEDVEGLPTRTDEERAGDIVIERVVFADNEAAGLLASGAAAPVVTDATFRGNGACAVCALGDGAVRVEGSTLDDNAVGFQITGASPIEIVGNTITDSETVSIAVEGTATPDIRDNVIAGDTASAFQITGQARSTLVANTVRGGPVGLLIAETAVATVRDNTFEGQEVALQSGDESTLTATGNTIETATLAAFSIGESSTVTVTANAISDAGGAAIEITGAATATLRDNEITGAGDVGISVTGDADVTSSGNRIDGRDIGIQAGETARLQLSGEVVAASAVAGLLLAGEASVAVRTVSATDGGGVGILVSETSDVTIEGGTSSGNTAGLIVRDTAAPTVTGVTVSGNEVGMQIEGASAPMISAATITGNVAAGVVYAGTATGELSVSAISENGPIGVQIGETAAPTVRGNTLGGGGDYAVLYVDGATGSVVDNVITGGVQFGIHLGGFAYPAVTGNVIEVPLVAAIAYTQASGGSAEGNRCPSVEALGIVRVPSATVTIGANECTVAVVEQ